MENLEQICEFCKVPVIFNGILWVEKKDQEATVFPQYCKNSPMLHSQVPEGAKIPKVMNQKVLAMRGIKFIYCGEGYSTHTTRSTSMLRAAIQRAINECDGVQQYA